MTEVPPIALALAVGFASFASPCILPIIPGFISSLAGTVAPDEIKKTRKAIFLSTLYFVLGFAVVFALLGTLIACVCGPSSVFGLQLKGFIAWMGGFLILGFGIFLILAMKIPRLNFEVLTQEKLGRKFTKQHASYVASWVIGATFAGAWTPCVGPLLGSVLAIAVTQPALAYNSLLAYAMGLGIPFLLIGAFFSQLTPVLKHIVKYEKYFNYVMAPILIVVGISILMGQFGVHF